MRLVKYRRYALVVTQLEDGKGWRAGIPAMNVWVVNPYERVARHQLKLKLSRAIKAVERGKAELANSDAVDDNEWWEVRIHSHNPDV